MTPDERFLRRALRLAARGRYRTAPNPRVGAVLVRDGRVVGQGYHREVGGAHAEREALTAAGPAARGTTLYVNLEPCNHHGRTPPCVDALLEAGVARVVACHRDPDPGVAGGGFERLRQAGVEVEWGALVPEAVRLNLGFLVSAVQRRPAISLKWAMSLDGRISSAGGESQWISSPEARRWALALREEHDAILVGSGTALADDPRLDRRLGRARGPILRVVLDRRLRLPPTARLFDRQGPVLIYTRSRQAGKRRDLEARGATLVDLEGEGDGAADVRRAVADLAARRVQSLLVEGGARVVGSFLAAGLYDRVSVDAAPLFLGGGAATGPVEGWWAESLGAAPRLDGLSAARRGSDVILTGYRERCLRELSSSVGG